MGETGFAIRIWWCSISRCLEPVASNSPVASAASQHAGTSPSPPRDLAGVSQGRTWPGRIRLVGIRGLRYVGSHGCNIMKPRHESPPRVLWANGHAILLDAFKRLLEPSCEVVGAVTAGRAMVEAALRFRPDVIVRSWRTCASNRDVRTSGRTHNHVVSASSSHESIPDRFSVVSARRASDGGDVAGPSRTP
jgi:hypothetical protein